MSALHAVINGLKVLVIADAVFSWVISDDVFPRSVTKSILDPVYAPVRSLLRPLTGSLDLAPMIAFLLLLALQKAMRSDTGR